MTSMTRLFAAVLLLIAVMETASSNQSADPGMHPFLSSKFNLSIGGFLPRKDIKLSARGTLEDDEILIDFNETFEGGETEDVFAVDFLWRFGKKWWMSAEMYSTDFREGAVLEKDKEWNNVLFPAGSFARAGFSTDLYRVVIGRQVYSSERGEFGVGIGIHWLKLGAFIEGEAIINNSTSGFRRESVRADAPLPNLSFWYVHAFNSRWAGFTRFDVFSASVKEYSGGLWNTVVGVEYQLSDKFGVSLSYKNFVLDVDVDKRGWYGQVEYSQKGPFLGLTATW
jgi:hypothetical protein